MQTDKRAGGRTEKRSEISSEMGENKNGRGEREEGENNLYFLAMSTSLSHSYVNESFCSASKADG